MSQEKFASPRKPEFDYLSELPKEGTPTIVISNHVFSLLALPHILNIKHKRPDTNVLCNMGFAPYLELLGLNTISVRTPLQDKVYKNVLLTAWSRFIKVSGEIFQKYKAPKAGTDIIETLFEKVAAGELVWITPAGGSESRRNRVLWKSGLGFLLRSCLENNIDPQIVLLQVNNHTKAQIKTITSIKTFVAEIEEVPEHTLPAALVYILQKKFWGE